MNRKEISNMMRGRLPDEVGFWAWQFPNGLIKIDHPGVGLKQSLLANSTRYIFGIECPIHGSQTVVDIDNSVIEDPLYILSCGEHIRFVQGQSVKG